MNLDCEIEVLRKSVKMRKKKSMYELKIKSLQTQSEVESKLIKEVLRPSTYEKLKKAESSLSRVNASNSSLPRVNASNYKTRDMNANRFKQTILVQNRNTQPNEFWEPKIELYEEENEQLSSLPISEEKPVHLKKESAQGLPNVTHEGFHILVEEIENGQRKELPISHAYEGQQQSGLQGVEQTDWNYLTPVQSVSQESENLFILYIPVEQQSTSVSETTPF